MDFAEGPCGGWVAFPGGWPHALQVTTATDFQEGRAQPWRCSAPPGGTAQAEERHTTVVVRNKTLQRDSLGYLGAL